MRHDQELLLKQLEQSWQFGTLPASAGGKDRLLHQAVLRVVGPIVAQQREFNASLVQFLYTLKDREDLDTVLNAVMAQVTATGREVSALRSDLNARIDTVFAFGGELSARLDTLEHDLNTRIDTLASFGGEISARLDTLEYDLNARLDTLSVFGGDLNDRLTRLAYATQLLDQAVVAGDEMDRVLANEIVSIARGERSQAAPASATPDPSIDQGAST